MIQKFFVAFHFTIFSEMVAKKVSKTQKNKLVSFTIKEFLLLA